MRYFIRYIKMMMRLTYSPSKIIPSEEMIWDEQDKVNLSTFMESGTGKRFSKILKNIEAETNAITVMKDSNTKWNNGNAFGNRTMLAHVFALSAIDPQPNEGDEYEALRRETGFEGLESLMSQYKG